MRLRNLLLLSCLAIAMFSACQEEDQALFKTPTIYKDINPVPPFKKFSLRSPSESNSSDGFIPMNDHVSFRYPRIPRPAPCPRLAGCQLPKPEFLVSVNEGGTVRELVVELYTEGGELYASSSKKYGGQVVVEGSEALASLVVIDDQMESGQLFMNAQITYEVNGEIYSDEHFDENVPINLNEYANANSVLFLFPRIPRPAPCPRLAGCQDPKPELHVIVPEANVLEMNAQLFTEEGELYACSGKECEGETVYQREEGLATLNVVNQEIETGNLILALQITYEINGKVVSEEIYSEDVPTTME